MANTTIQLKRSSVAGKQPNTSTLSIGELAINITDKKLYSSDGSAIFEPAANVTNINITGGLKANGSFGSNSQILYSNGSTVYWSNSSTIIDTQDNNPTSPSDGKFYWNSALGKLLVYYEDGTSGQWVEAVYATAPAAANGGGGGGGDAAAAYSNAVSYADTKAATAYVNAVSYADTKISLVNTAITSNSSTAYSNAVSYADAKAANAYSNAVSYADAKAANAYSNATSYADAKAANAYSNATAYADAKAANAYSNAVSYTDAKAGNAYSNAVSYIDLAIGTANTAMAANAAAAYSNAVSYTDAKAGNAYSNAISYASNADNISSGTVAEVRLPYRMNQNVRTTDTVEFNGLTLTGNLVVSGNVNIIGANNLSISDNMIYLNSNNDVSNPDLGFAGNYNDGTYHHAGFFRDATDGVWKVFDSYAPEPDASAFINTANATFRIADFQANSITANNFVGNGASVTSVNAITVGGNSASDLRTYADNKAANAYSNAVSYTNLAIGTANTAMAANAATAYSNAVSYADTKAASAYSNAIAYSGNAAAAYTNAVSYTDTKIGLVNTAITSNAATAYTNAVSYVDGKSYVNTSQLSSNLANYVQNTDSRTLSGNLNFTGANTTITGSLSSANLTTTTNTATIGTAAYVVANGNVGIGTSSPAGRLHARFDAGAADGYTGKYIFQTTDQRLTLGTYWQSGVGQYARIQASNDTGTVNTPLLLNPDGGNVGIGTNSPGAKLDVVGPSVRLGSQVVGDPFSLQLRTFFETCSHTVGAYGGYTISCPGGVTIDNGFAYLSVGSLGVTLGNANFDMGPNTLTCGSINSSGSLQTIDIAANNISADNDISAFGRVLSGGGTVGAPALSPYGYGTTGIFFPASGTTAFSQSGVEAMRIDSSGRITMPYQTSFHATGSGSQSWTGTAQYLKLQLNTSASMGSRSTNYNTSTYRFTATVAGSYMFYGKITPSTNGATGPEAVFAINGSVAAYVAINYAATGTGSYMSNSGQVIIQLSAGDYVELMVVNNNSTTFTLDLTRCCFGGHLIG